MSLGWKQPNLLSKHFCVVAVMVVLIAPSLLAQTNSPSPNNTQLPVITEPQKTAEDKISFEVASIRQNQSDIHARSHIYSSPHNGNFTAINVPPRMLLQFAFGLPDSRIIGGPDWLNSDKYDIEAKADESVDDKMNKLTSDQGQLVKQEMLQALFVDRFQLKVHYESRDLPVYFLVVAKSGPKLKESKRDGVSINSGRDYISIQGNAAITNLADKLAKNLDRIVIDKTGIDGRYDIALKWTPDDSAAPKLNGATDASTDASGPSIFTAIEEQLGLKLESKKAPVDVLVIDHIERPSQN